MNLMSNELFKAVRYALYAGATAAVGISAIPALAQDDSGQKLETITVTGSNIRRVDVETSNPVFTIDKAEIQKSGKLTVGDLLQQMPTIAGGATNPQVNNGGGTGASTISLRGLGSDRTLILINGHRTVTNDVNAIPAALIERVEVLRDGASATYGSDAVAGVVNFVLRSDYQGAEVTASYGISDHDDGARRGFNFVLGQTSEHGSLVVGVDYNKQNNTLAKNRKFSETSYAISTDGYVYTYGNSSRSPTGQFSIPRSVAEGFGLNCPGTNARVNVTRNTGQAGSSPDQYHCYVTANDAYNTQVASVQLTTPSERGSIFFNGDYKISDSISMYATGYYNKTTAHQQLAPLPLIFGTDSGAVLTHDSYYNPFGVDIASGGLRMLALGPRVTRNDTDVGQVTAGFKGNLPFTETWQWDAGARWGKTTANTFSGGYLSSAGLAQAVGPSFMGSDGQVHCGTPDAPIDGCTPINLFGLNQLTGAELERNVAALQALSITPSTHSYGTIRNAFASANGDIIDLPAGALSAAVGLEYYKEYSYFEPDAISKIGDPEVGTCLTSQDACASAAKGTQSRKEVYAELLVPIVKDLPFAHSLTLTVGARYSKYDTFGSTTNSKFAIEYRPIEDLLLRGTVTEVFRAPTIGDLFSGVTPSATPYSDPCAGNGYNNSPVCAGLSGPGFIPATTQIRELIGSNDKLKPEFGKSFDFGVVYDPHWLDGLSVSADLWRIYLNNTIGTLGVQTILSQCHDFGRFCDLIGPRDDSGELTQVLDVAQNIGRLDAQGVDFAAHYRLPETAFGRFNFGLEATYLRNWDQEVVAGIRETRTHNAGNFISVNQGGNGSYPRWRAVGTVGWALAGFDAGIQARYIGASKFGDTAPTPDGSNTIPVLPGHRQGGVTYFDLRAGYNIEPINTYVQFGIDNVGDKKPPFVYQYTLNDSVDDRTYDLYGRYYFGSVTVKF